MRPVLFHWRGRPVSSYAALLYVGMVAGIAAGNVVARRNGLPTARVWVATLLLIPLALLGARFAYVLRHREAFRGDPGAVFRRSAGGQAMLGGLVAVPLSVPLLAALGVPFRSFWDVATFTMLTGMIFARAGCLLNGCCSGRPTAGRFGLELSDHRGVRVRRVPMQLLEGLLAVGLLIAATALNEQRPPPGAVFLVSLAAYLGVRLLLQRLRDTGTRNVRPSMQRVAAAGTALVALSSSLRGLE